MDLPGGRIGVHLADTIILLETVDAPTRFLSDRPGVTCRRFSFQRAIVAVLFLITVQADQEVEVPSS